VLSHVAFEREGELANAFDQPPRLAVARSGPEQQHVASPASSGVEIGTRASNDALLSPAAQLGGALTN